MTEYGKNAPLSYNKYLKVPELISLQETLSEPKSHDELLFIIIHQTYELWFKQILHEIDATLEWLKQGRAFRVNHSLRTVTAIEKVIVSQIHILESMAQIGFLEFRDKLKQYEAAAKKLTQLRQSRQRGFNADSTTPSSVILIASAGQTSAQVGSVQCIQTVGIVAVVSARSI